MNNISKKIIMTLSATLLSANMLFAGESLDRVMRSKTLTVATDTAYPPFSFINDNNEMDGFDVAVGRAIAKQLGVKLKVVTPGWDIITAGNWHGRWDISVGSMTPNENRAKVLDFPAEYYYTPNAVAVHKKSKMTKISQLSGKKVGVASGTTPEMYLKGNMSIYGVDASTIKYEIKNAKIKAYDTDVNAYDDLRIGDGKRLDGIVSSLPVILEAIKSGYPMKIIGNNISYEPLAVATDKGDKQFNQAIKKAVNTLKSNGTLSKLSKKWLNFDYTKRK